MLYEKADALDGPLESWYKILKVFQKRQKNLKFINYAVAYVNDKLNVDLLWDVYISIQL